MCFVCGPTLHLLKLWKKKIKNDMTPLTTFLLWSPKLLSSECFDFIKYFLNSNVIRPSRESIKFMLLQFPKNKIKKKKILEEKPCRASCRALHAWRATNDWGSEAAWRSTKTTKILPAGFLHEVQFHVHYSNFEKPAGCDFHTRIIN